MRPAWLLSHVLVVGLLIVTANLGFWQLRRLDARRDYNAVVAARAGGRPGHGVRGPEAWWHP